MTVTFELHPRNSEAEQVVIYRDGQEIERCSLRQRSERLAPHSYRAAKAPRYGWRQSGTEITKRGARR